MKYFRFMSEEEFEKFKNGEELINEKVHQGRTNSVGFWFLNYEEYPPEQALHFLVGIANTEICAVFETKRNLRKSIGIYAKPNEIKSNRDLLADICMLLYGIGIKPFEVNEYCTTHYNNKDFKLVKYSKDLLKQWKPYNEQQKIEWFN